MITECTTKENRTQGIVVSRSHLVMDTCNRIRPDCRRCALDNAFSTRVPCQLEGSSAPVDSQQHCCTVNFNADGSLWACVPASCLLTGCTTAACSLETEDEICKDLAQQLESMAAWISSKKNLVQVLLQISYCSISSTKLSKAIHKPD